jgi:hypothetical protein
MLPNFLLPEQVVRQNGEGPVIALGKVREQGLTITLGITRIIEQESIDLAIWGSTDGTDWGAKPIVKFPQKFYCGTYTQFIDLSEHANLTHIKVAWKLNRWGRGEPTPLFGLYVFAQETPLAVAVGV